LTLQNKHGTAGAELHKFVRQIAFKIFRICFDQGSGTFADPIATGHGPLGAAGPEAAASLASIMVRLCTEFRVLSVGFGVFRRTLKMIGLLFARY